MSAFRIWLVIAALFGASGVALGAYRAHGLEKMLKARELPDDVIAKRLENVETGVRYQMYHAFALLAVGLLVERQRGKLLNVAGGCFTLGTILFADPLFLLALADIALPWYVIPSGGVLLIAGWVVLGIAVLRISPGQTT